MCLHPSIECFLNILNGEEFQLKDMEIMEDVLKVFSTKTLFNKATKLKLITKDLKIDENDLLLKLTTELCSTLFYNLFHRIHYTATFNPYFNLKLFYSLLSNDEALTLIDNWFLCWLDFQIKHSRKMFIGFILYMELFCNT
jgi:hypothetical protein